MKQRMIMRRALAAVCALAAAMSLAGCGTSSEEGMISIGIKFDQPGLGFKKSGTSVGFDVDVARYVADFAGPYFIAGQDLLVRKGDDSIRGPEDLNGKRLCSVTGSTSAKNVKNKFANEVQLMEQPGYAECATALFSGIVDAVTTDDIILAGLASASRGKLEVVGAPFTEEYYGVGIKKGNSALAAKINDAINQMVEDGSWQRAVEDNTRGTGYRPNAKVNPPKATEGVGHDVVATDE